MRWKLLDSITELTPGKEIVGTANTRFPDELFGDHFPSFPVTPGVLLVEMTAQLAGKLIEATVWENDGFCVFPILSIIRDSKFRQFVPPRVDLVLEATLVELREESAMCRGRVIVDGKRHANMTLVFVFEPGGKVPGGKQELLEKHEREAFTELGSPWLPPEAP